MYEQLIAERGGTALAGPGEITTDGQTNGAEQAPFVCLVVEEEGLLPLLARLSQPSADRITLLLKSGRVGGGEEAAGSLPITEADAAATLDAALGDDARWECDPDLRIELLVSGAPGVAEELLIPRFLYRRADRIYEYAAAVPALLEQHSWLGPGERPDARRESVSDA